MVELRGIVASDGVFAGPIVRLDALRQERRHSGSAEAERQVLATAIETAASELVTLTATVTGDAADMLSFQLAMLEDDALRDPALAAIADGAAADAAWAAALDAEIAGYESSDDEYFRARAADLRDIRDRVLRHVHGEAGELVSVACVFMGEDIAPTRFLETDWSRGGAIALSRGSNTSHVAMLARARAVPMVVGLGPGSDCEARNAIVNGDDGSVILDPSAAALAEFEHRRTSQLRRKAIEQRFRDQEARLRNGTRIDVLVNVACVDELAQIDAASCDGIGLMRSEFLFADGKPLPDEDAQYRAYRRFAEWAEGRPVTIRTLDIGGDKPVRGLTPEGERNPFLGLRGVRLTLARPEVFRTQLRALARAAAHGPLKIMLPMVTVPQELIESAALLDACVAELKEQGIACARPPLGIMVEVPAVAICPELFFTAAFFSIGSNDLTQYVTATSRDEPAVAALNDPAHPAVLRLIETVLRYGREKGIPVSLCGDMASEPSHLSALLAAGLTSLSVAPARLGRIKAALAEL